MLQWISVGRFASLHEIGPLDLFLQRLHLSTNIRTQYLEDPTVGVLVRHRPV